MLHSAWNGRSCPNPPNFRTPDPRIPRRVSKEVFENKKKLFGFGFGGDRQAKKRLGESHKEEEKNDKGGGRQTQASKQEKKRLTPVQQALLDLSQERPFSPTHRAYDPKLGIPFSISERRAQHPKRPSTMHLQVECEQNAFPKSIPQSWSHRLDYEQATAHPSCQ